MASYFHYRPWLGLVYPNELFFCFGVIFHFHCVLCSIYIFSCQYCDHLKYVFWCPPVQFPCTPILLALVFSHPQKDPTTTISWWWNWKAFQRVETRWWGCYHPFEFGKYDWLLLHLPLSMLKKQTNKQKKSSPHL